MNYCRANILVFVVILFASLKTYAESTDFSSVIDKIAIWDDSVIAVCWDNPTAQFKNEMRWTKSAVNSSWADNSALNFIGWQKCADSSKGIRIRIADEWPRVRNFGKYLDGLEGGVILNFTFKGEFKCYRAIRDCIEIIAVHEFGHALGFHHEQNRSDTKEKNSACYKEEYQGRVPNELKIGEWDLQSVMNYCNPKWNGNGNLSAGDIDAIKKIYGENPISNESIVSDSATIVLNYLLIM